MKTLFFLAGDNFRGKGVKKNYKILELSSFIPKDIQFQALLVEELVNK